MWHLSGKIDTEREDSWAEKRLSIAGRVLLGAIGFGLAGLWLVARAVEPDPRGYGTHQQLGLPPCNFQRLTEWRCPSCGMTTSFAYLARAQPIQAFWANPGGCLVALTTLVVAPWCWVSSLQGRLVGVKAPGPAAIGLVLTLLGATLIAWMIRLAVGG